MGALRLDYICHMLLFVPWMLLFPGRKLTTPIIWFFSGLGVALLAEGVQVILPHRTFNLNDIIGNSIGVFVGLLIYVAIREWNIRAKHPTIKEN